MKEKAFEDPELNKLTNSLNINIQILEFLGIWPQSSSVGAARKFFRNFRYCLFFCLFMYGMLVCHMIYIYLNYSSILSMIRCMCTASVIFMVIFKAETLRQNPEMVSEVLNMLRELAHPTFKQNRDAVQSIISSCKHVKWGTKLVFYTGGIVALSAWTVPLRYNEDIYVAWYPYDGTTKRFFFIYLFQVSVVTISPLAGIAMDTMISGLLALCAGQIQAQNCEFRDVVDFTVQEMTKENPHVTLRKNHLHVNSEFQKLLEKNFRICVERHQKVIKFVRIVHKGFGLILFIQMAVSATIICTLMFIFTLLDPMSTLFVGYAFYFAITAQQIFLFCWHGNDITFKSEKFMVSIIESDWLAFGSKMRPKLIMLLAFNQTPIRFNVGKIIPVNVETFLRIINTSWSIFTLLKSVQIKDGTTV